MKHLRRQNDPPPPGPERHVRRIGAGGSGTFVILAEPWGTWTHWNGSKTEPCFEDAKECNGCKRGHPLRWKCYLHVFNFNGGEDEFLELTPGAMRALNRQLPRDTPMRGQRFSVRRGNGQKARLYPELQAPYPNPAGLPKGRDPYNDLMRLWGFPVIADVRRDATHIPPAEAV